MILAVALATIIGPTAGITYSRCQLASLLKKHGITQRIPDCKYSKILTFSPKTDFKTICGDDVELINP
jgi:hypothetical protein